MGKHLAPKPKHELNFILNRANRASGQTASAHAARGKREASAPESRREARIPETKREAPARRGAGRAPAERPHFKLPKLSVPRVKFLQRLPSMGRFSWLFPLLAALLLLALRFVPLEGWMIPAAWAVPALLALMEHAADAFENIRSGRYLNNALFTCLSAVLLFATGLYTEAVLLLILTSLTGRLEKSLNDRSQENLDKVMEILPTHAVLVTDEGLERIDPAAVSVGDILLVRAGERIPLDGVVTEGISTIDTVAVSGQRSPWAVNTGYKVYSGCRNLTSDIKIRVSRPYEQSTVRKLTRLAAAATDFPSEQENTVRRFLFWYQCAALALALLLGVILPIFRGNWIVCLRRAAVLLIAARAVTECFGIPLLYRRTLSTAEKLGVFSKGEDCLEAMARAETVIFDKTGTITEGRYAVTDVYPVKMSERQLLTIAATAESFSRHPIAAAIREAAGKLDERVIRAVKIRDFPGRGVSAFLGSHQVYVGNAALLEEHGIKYNIPARPGTAIHVSVDERYCGYILVTDKVRRRAFDALESLRVGGVKKLVLLTGDVFSVARPIASRLNFDMLRAELKPEEKAKAVGYLMNNKGQRSTIAFVGEGENSGKIMSGADVGIAMGSLGSDAALARADVLVMDRDIFKIPKTLAISRQVYRAALVNLGVGFGTNAVIALFGALGVFSPLAAVIASAACCLLLLGNSLRIK